MTFFQKILRRMELLLGIRVYRVSGREGEKKIDYQTRFRAFDIKAGERVLDLGSGGEPFPYATHLVDLYPGETQHRYNPLKTDGKIFVEANIEHLPFTEKEFDYVYCSHVLEHVESPKQACEEILRVGKRGYIELPTRLSDILFNFVKIPNFHRWHVHAQGNTLIFQEYQDYERVDTKCGDFYALMHSKKENALRSMYRTHKNLFVNMFHWTGSFNYFVFDKAGNLIASSKTA